MTGQRAIPCMFMRAGTSRGPFFLASDLPDDREQLEAVLLRAMGSPDDRQIDGLGGATTVTSKVAIVSLSEHPDADLDYLFAQVEIERCAVDFSPTCGNMLSGVAPFAIERGLVATQGDHTEVVVRNVNTDSLIDVIVQTPDGIVNYDGDQAIAGVPGTAAAIELRFRNITGSATGALLPTGNRIDTFAGLDVTCVDVAMPLVMARAVDMGFTGHETIEQIHGNAAFMARMRDLRQLAADAMGMGDVSESVIPKFAMVAPAANGGHFASRYLTPSQCHPTYAVSGAIAAATSALIEGTVTSEVVSADDRLPTRVEIEHPSGSINVDLRPALDAEPMTIHSGGTVRTARPVMDGSVLIPSTVWP